MGKRSTFERIHRDKYATPLAAAKPLFRWLEAKSRFIEPCVGEGFLAGHLKQAGHVMIAAYDWPDDARSKIYDPPPGALFITNPPYWGRPKDLHPLITNLSDQAPTWLLMSADWLFNKTSGPLTRRLRQVVAIGRVKWIPGSRYIGKENAAWLLFERESTRAYFIGRR